MDIYLEQKRASLLAKVIKGWLPESGKRMVFITSLACLLAKGNGECAVDLEQVKQKLSLSPPLRSMVFPALIHSSIWKCVECIPQQGKDFDLRKFKEEILNKCPAWLVYGNDINRTRDIESVLNLLNIK